MTTNPFSSAFFYYYGIDETPIKSAYTDIASIVAHAQAESHPILMQTEIRLEFMWRVESGAYRVIASRPQDIDQ